MEFFYSNKTASQLAVKQIGAKAKNLGVLEHNGFNVPNWGVVTAESLRKLIPKGTVINSQSIKAVQITEIELDKIFAHFEDVEYFAVRSSGSDEDNIDHSFAGQYDSFLYVPKDQLAEKIKAVWQSVFSPRITSYRKEHSLPVPNGISVIIQAMIDADVSGVAFGMNPLTGNRAEKVISSIFGLGEGLVSGDLEADNYLLTKEEHSECIARKTHKYRMSTSSNGGTEKQNLDENEIEKSSLSKAQLLEIKAVLDSLFDKLGRYQDIEFAYANNTLFLLQTRPITKINQLPHIGSKYIVWDNSNIIESYPGITLPLTFSYIIKIYAKAYRQFVALLGVPSDIIDKNANYFDNMLGLLNGRVYYNLRSWYKMISILPGYSLNAGFMEKMMGVKEQFELDDIEKKGKLKGYLNLLVMVFKIIKNLLTLEKQKQQFSQFFDSFIKEYDGVNPDDFSANELMDLYINVESVMLNEWKAPLVNDFFAMIYFGMLSKTAEKYLGQDSNVHNDLLCGAHDIVSTKPVQIIKALVNLISGNAKLKAIFTKKHEDDIWSLIQQGELPEIEALVKEYINDFGDRYVGELKLETQTYTQNPQEFVAVIKSYILANTSFETQHNIELELRQNAEEKIKDLFKGKPIKKHILKHIISKTRQLVSGRENLRLYRTKAFGKTRLIFRALGKKFFAENLLADKEDIFYLTKEEIFDFIKGTSVNYDLKALVEYRKQQFDALKNQSPQAERITSYGMVYNGNDFSPQKNNKVLEGDLNGIACCKGVVKGRIQIVYDPKETSNLNGDILVTSSTDPGWVTLFPSVSGILVERGSLLSHSAIVSREMGIPCIVGVNSLLATLKTGDIIEMDGGSGKIKIVQQTKSSEII